MNRRHDLPALLGPFTTLLSLCLCAAAFADDLLLPETVLFNRDIRPILSDTCFACHGPDERQRKAEYRLDTEQGALSDRGGYRAIDRQKPGDSELLHRIFTDDADDLMPPPKSGRKLTERQKALLKRWIEQGAQWQGHWAYIAPTRPTTPQVGEGEPIANEIDTFIARMRHRMGLKALEPADRVTLIRRLSFDLTGLPPTPEQVADFVNDGSPDAYEKVVDRLLASPHYGERMAMYWLDLVRYADTTGIHGDNHREVWLYRNWVIDAFNANMPFDRFTIEQLAGDLLPNRTSEQVVASGYNRLLMTTQEGGAQAKEYLAKYAADRVRNASSVWMGATLGCSECHDHKFDPYSMRDFYSFAAFFADIQEVAVGEQPTTPIPTAEQTRRIAELDGQIAAMRKVIDTPTNELASAQAQWEIDVKQRRQQWVALRPTQMKSNGGATLTLHEDGAITATGTNPDKDVYTLTVTTDLRGVTALRLEAMPDGSLPASGPGRAGNGNFVVSEVQIAAVSPAVDDKPAGETPLAIGHVSGTHEQNGWPIVAAADGKPETGWAILPQTGKANHLVFELKDDVAIAAGQSSATLVIRIHQNHGGAHTLGRFRIEATTAARPVRADGAGAPANIAAILDKPADMRSPDEANALAVYYRTIAPLLEPQRKQLADLTAQRKAVEDAMPRTLVSMSGSPRTMRVLPRGNWLDDSGAEVNPAVPAFLKPLELADRRATRLDLAHWIVAPDNPLTARVFVNRLWKIAFGHGIVTTPDDFGSQGAWPTHPELLDWLAVRFIDSGWDVKAMLKFIVMSHTYRLGSNPTADMRRIDPYNKWYARQWRYRLDAEVVRDNALAVSGLLVDQLGGPSVRPYQPPKYWVHLNFPTREYQNDTGDNLYRRGLYTYWCRTFLHPSLLAFDAPTREECTVERPRSNTPLQALVLLNDPIYVEAARVLAERLMREGESTVERRVQSLYRLALSREARAEELSLLTDLYERHLADYRADSDAAKGLLTVGAYPTPGDLDAAELAAWTSVSRVLLNLHETITRP